MDFQTIAEKSVLADHKAHVGKVLFARMLTGYVGDTDVQIDLAFKNPIEVRVGLAMEGDLIRYQDDWLDPVWSVTILDKNHPELPKGGLRSCWLHGTSYNWKNGDIEPSQEFVPLSDDESDKPFVCHPCSSICRPSTCQSLESRVP